MVQNYKMDKALGFRTEYMQGCLLAQRRMWNSNRDPTMNDEIVEGKGQQQALTTELWERIHEFVLIHVKLLQSYREYVISLYP